MKADIRNLKKIINYCQDISDDVEYYGHNLDDFLNCRRFQHSCAFCLTQIGEIVKRLPPELLSKYPEISWKIAGLRDVISHGYESIDYESIWLTVVNDVPNLLLKCVEIVSESDNAKQPRFN